jgi:hypothetical protein
MAAQGAFRPNPGCPAPGFLASSGSGSRQAGPEYTAAARVSATPDIPVATGPAKERPWHTTSIKSLPLSRPADRIRVAVGRNQGEHRGAAGLGTGLLKNIISGK